MAPERVQPVSYRDLKVWQIGIDLVIEAYHLAQILPDTERFGLRVQVQRAAVSVPANIAEGHGRLHRGDYLRFLSIANGSLKELETEVYVAVRLEYVSAQQAARLFDLADQLGRMLRVLMARLRHGAASPSPIPNP